MNTKGHILDVNKTASVLEISTATVRNWIKHGHIKPLKIGNGLFFDASEINTLKSGISDGNVNRLNKRANKINIDGTFIPKEYLENESDLSLLNQIVYYIQERGIDVEKAIFLLTLNLLKKEGILNDLYLNRSLSEIEFQTNNQQIIIELKNWSIKFKSLSMDDKDRHLLEFEIPAHRDAIGLIYQSLLLEGAKSKTGSYYTPQEIVTDISNTCCREGMRILDPCCGTGQFLLAFSEKQKEPENLYGIDIDELAVRIARINFLLKFREIKFAPHIYHRDALVDFEKYNLFISNEEDMGVFDLIATNPPWGVQFSDREKKHLKEMYPQINSFESFSYFLKKSIDWLKDDGVLSFILPESILHIKAHSDIRKYIVGNMNIERIVYLDRVFENVFTPVIRIDLRKSRKKKNSFIVQKADESYRVSQSRMAGNQGYIFDIHSNKYDLSIIDKIYSIPYVTLKENADWALGIVTGDNDKYLSFEEKEGCERIYRGKDIEKFRLKQAAVYIYFTPEKFQQVAPEFKYRTKEKLIYRFISKHLIFAYDDRQRLTLNSANVVIPHIEDYSIRVILALLNSSVHQFIFQKKFSTIKVLRSHIEELPLPLWNKDIFDDICNMTDEVIKGKNNADDLDKFIMGKFNLKEDEIEYIQRSIN